MSGGVEWARDQEEQEEKIKNGYWLHGPSENTTGSWTIPPTAYPIDEIDEVTTPDAINHPAHYTQSKIEPIDVIVAWKLGFHLGNCIKYVARAEHKGTLVQDLKKARWYLDDYIKRLEAGEDPR